MSWTFSYEGKIFDPQGNFAGTAYAGGDEGLDPQAIDNPAYEGVKNEGPLPEGLYSFGVPIDHSQLGPFAIPLIPDPSNNMKGRGDFFCHGDTAIPGKASKGCIVTNPTLRHTMAASEDQQIQVVASYVPPVSSV